MVGDNNLASHLARYKLDQIVNQLEDIWVESGAWTIFVDDLHQALSNLLTKNGETGGRLASLILLPGLCCEAAGGNPAWADDLASAWYLFYVAADLMDKVQDQDEIEPWLSNLGTARILSLASGLYFSASSMLNQLFYGPAPKLVAAEVTREVNNGFLKMCGGQHRDLARTQPSLSESCEIAAAKSGSFFSMACSAGARLATDQDIRIDGFKTFGHHLGILIQLFDDLEDLRCLREDKTKRTWSKLEKTLPFIYAREVSPSSFQSRLQHSMQDSGEVHEVAERVFEIISECGTALYINVEIERHREAALAGLARAEPLPDPGEKLVEILNSFTSI